MKDNEINMDAINDKLSVSAVAESAGDAARTEAERMAFDGAATSIRAQITLELTAPGHTGHTHGTRTGYIYYGCRGPMCLYANSRGRRGAQRAGDTLSDRIERRLDEIVTEQIERHHEIREAEPQIRHCD